MKQEQEINDIEQTGLEDLIEAEEVAIEQEAIDQAEAEAAENEPSQAELERARIFAEKINGVFLFGVNRAVCPSVPDIDQIVDREAGNEALVPLALEMGGTMPPWLAQLLEKYDPYIKAGVYMGMTIYTASRVEKAIREEEEEKEQAKGGGNVAH